MLNEYKIISEIVRNILMVASVLVGGIWSYYRFVKGRLLSPKIELGLTTKISYNINESKLVGCEVSIKNIGAIQLRPTRCNVLAKGHWISNESVSEMTVCESHDVLPFSTSDKGKCYYIDPGESSYRATLFFVPANAIMLSIKVTIDYNTTCRTERNFQVVLREHNEKLNTEPFNK